MRRIASVYREQPRGPFPDAPTRARVACALVVPPACVPTTASSVAPSPWDRRWMAVSMNSSMTSRKPLSARQAPPATPRSAVEARQSLHREDRSLLELITPRLALSSSFAYDHIGSYIVPRERVPARGDRDSRRPCSLRRVHLQFAPPLRVAKGPASPASREGQSCGPRGV